MSFLRPKSRERKPPRARRCAGCDGSGVQGAMCSGDYCTCGGDGHIVRCYWCYGSGLRSAEMKRIARDAL